MVKYRRSFNYLPILFTLCTASVLGVLNQENACLKADVVSRLTTLQRFVQQNHYKWHIHWMTEGIRQYGSLEGLQQGHAHWVTVIFPNNKTLIFNKNNPCVALYPNKLCLCKPDVFTAPLENLSGVCIYMIAMPFLSWDVLNCTKTAKLGRRAIKVLLANHNLYAEIFLDKHFNTILQAKMWDTQNNFHASFTLKNLKKFKGHWNIQTAEFTLNNHKTLLYVDDVEMLD